MFRMCAPAPKPRGPRAYYQNVKSANRRSLPQDEVEAPAVAARQFISGTHSIRQFAFRRKLDAVRYAPQSTQIKTMNRLPSASKPQKPSSKLAQTAWHSADTSALLDMLSKSLRRALLDHQSMLDILRQRHAELPLSLGELLEDASNAYMEMSESVSRQFLNARTQLAE
jgi:hypothetical protein